MGTFIKFLLETKGSENEATLVFHKLLSMLDHGHLDITENSVKFNVGAIIKDSSYSKVIVLIKKGGEAKTRLGIHREDGNVYIVMGASTLPERSQLVSFLEDKNTAKSFISVFQKYLTSLHQEPEDAHKTKDEMSSEINTDEKFEELYNKVLEAVDEAMSNHDKANGHTGDVFNKFNVNKEETRKMTLDMMKKDSFGNDEAEFAKKFMSVVPEIAHLNKEYKEKMESRLKSLFISKIASK